MPSKRAKHSESQKKKQKLDSSDQHLLYTFLNSALSLVHGLKDGVRIVDAMFLKLPSKKLYPDYYEKIESPVSLNEIKSKTNNKLYQTAEEFVKDFELMAENAITYNLKESLIAQDAEKIREFVSDQVDQYESEVKQESQVSNKLKLVLNKKDKEITGDFASQPVVGDTKQKLVKLLTELIEFEYEEQPIADVFLDAPSKKLYPDYYKIITEPMAITIVQKKLTGKKEKYSTVQEFIDDIALIWTNAQTYNEESSLIYVYSEALLKFFDTKIQQLTEDFNESQEEARVDAENKANKKKGKPTKNPGLTNFKIKLNVNKDKRGRPPKNKQAAKVKTEEADAIGDGSDIENDITSEAIAEGSVLETKPDEIEETEEEEPQITARRFKDGSEALVKLLSIHSTRPKSNNLTQRNAYGQNNSDSQFSLIVFQNWFEYKFSSEDYKIQNYSLSLPIYNSMNNKGAISILATLDDSLTEMKYSNVLTVNDETVKPSPSVIYADSDKGLVSKYDLKLALGLNNIQLSIRVLNETLGEINGGVDSTNILTEPTKLLPEETVSIWVNVCQ